MADSKLAFLGMPGYGELSAGASKGFWRASMGSHARIPVRVDRQYHHGSLLAANLNWLWCYALNLCHQGERVDYFAMLHSDVEPEDWWLDTLIEEMEAKQLDVLGVPVAIKDSHGLTSLALERPDRNPWLVHCRLTTTEIANLPETFTSEDIGYRLLLNTGCWVCRFDPSWSQKVHFTINDRIYFDQEKNRWMANVAPEDWNFSRQCHDLGLRIGATRKIAADHKGATWFRGNVGWGDPFDTAYLKQSVLQEPAADGWRFPFDVDGWLTLEEGKGLAELARGKRVLEIGSYCGRSTICMAQTAEHVTSVDPHDGRGTPRPMNTRQSLAANLKRYGCENVSIIVGTVEDNGAYLYPPFDMIFVDGAHDYESVKRDIDNAQELLVPGGTLAFHDYRRSPGEHDGRWDEGVTIAVDELIADGADLVSRHGTVAVVRPPVLVGA